MELRRGIIAGIGAYVIWGGSPIYWNAIKEVPPPEALAWRVVWAVAIVLLFLAARSNWDVLRGVVGSRKTLGISVVAGTLLTANWAIFLWAVTTGHIVEVSLGYYINPLMNVALGVMILHERLSTPAKVSVAIAALAVVSMTIAGDTLPWIALSLAITFAMYGLLKKQPEAAPPLEGLLIEVTTAAVPLVAYLIYLVVENESVVVASPQTWALIPFSGAITVAPLLLFGIAAQRIPLSTIGMLQYLAPTIQLVIGVYLFAETVTPVQKFGFASVWLALGIYAADSILRSRRPTA
ncbi:MAG: chloramphenicol-sensitive protein RarD [Myxococcota bacterium]